MKKIYLCHKNMHIIRDDNYKYICECTQIDKKVNYNKV